MTSRSLALTFVILALVGCDSFNSDTYADLAPNTFEFTVDGRRVGQRLVVGPVRFLFPESDRNAPRLYMGAAGDGELGSSERPSFVLSSYSLADPQPGETTEVSSAVYYQGESWSLSSGTLIIDRVDGDRMEGRFDLRMRQPAFFSLGSGSDITIRGGFNVLRASE